jgi:AcrR family transcriptional regulator
MPRKRNSRSSKTNESILSSAATLLAENGYQQTTLDAIASRAGVTRATIYYHFDSKEHLYEALIRKYLQGATERLQSQVESGKSWRDTFIDIWLSYIDDALNPERRYIFYQDVIRLRDQHAVNIRQEQREYERMFAEHVQRAQEAGVLVRGDPLVITFLIFGAIGRTALWFRPEGRVPLDEFRDLLMRVLIGGFMVSPCSESEIEGWTDATGDVSWKGWPEAMAFDVSSRPKGTNLA